MADPITAYCEPPDLVALAIQPKALARVPIDVQEDAIEANSRLIDSYLRSHYTLPLTQVGKDMVRACAILTVYDLLASRGYNPEGAADEVLERRYDKTIRWLEQIAAGRAFPDVTDSSSGATPGNTTASGPRVTSATSRGWSNRGTNGPGGGFTID